MSHPVASTAAVAQCPRAVSGTGGVNTRAPWFVPAGTRALAALLVLIAVAGGASVRAEVALYEADVVWHEGDAAAREEAFRQALRQVLVKVTGLRYLGEPAQVASLVENAQALVQQYELRTATVASGDAAVAEPRLWVRFDEAAVDRLIEDGALPIWSRPRPSLLVWLVARRDGIPRVAGSEGGEGIAELLRQGAESRGVPLVLPLLDLEDQVLSGPPELWIDAERQIRAASRRYGPGAVLIGQLDRTILWEARWSLLLAGGVHRWVSEGQLLDLVVDEGVQEAIDALSVRYASSEPEVEHPSVVVSVSGVHDFKAYVRAIRYLESLDAVHSVDVLGVVFGRVRLGLELRSGVAGLRELLALGSTLAEDAGDLDGVLALRLLP